MENGKKYILPISLHGSDPRGMKMAPLGILSHDIPSDAIKCELVHVSGHGKCQGKQAIVKFCSFSRFTRENFIL